MQLGGLKETPVLHMDSLILALLGKSLIFVFLKIWNSFYSKTHRKAAASEGWLQKAAEEADLIVDGDDDSDEEFYQVFATLKIPDGSK